jgi:hypothetical protein
MIVGDGRILGLLAGAVPAVLLGALYYRRLRNSHFTKLSSALLTGLVVGQAGMMLALAAAPYAAWLALAAYAIAACAGQFAQRQTARSIILLGGSLAGVQLVAPVGGFLAAALLPVMGCIFKGSESTARAFGLLMLLVFAPVVLSFLLAILARGAHLDAARLLMTMVPAAFPLPAAVQATPVRGVVCDLALIAPVAPIFLRTLADAPSRAAALHFVWIAGVFAAVGIALSSFGAQAMALEMVAAPAPIALVALSAWPQSRTRARDAIAAAALGWAVSWPLLFLTLAAP